jgi:hypothetical protein
MSDEIDIGHGVTISYFTTSLAPDGVGLISPPSGLRYGLILRHTALGKTESGRCACAVFFRDVPGKDAIWQLVREDPLTLSPSILCNCGFHGFIRDGKWVPA